MAQGHLQTNLDVIPENLSSVWAWWTKRSVYLWYDHLAAVFVPTVGLEYIISNIEALIEFYRKGIKWQPGY